MGRFPREGNFWMTRFSQGHTAGQNEYCGLHSSSPGLKGGGSTWGFARQERLGYNSQLSSDWSPCSVEQSILSWPGPTRYLTDREGSLLYKVNLQ